jgi:ATP-dependent DNA ligase
MKQVFYQLTEADRDKLKEKDQPKWTKPIMATLTNECFSDMHRIFEFEAEIGFTEWTSDDRLRHLRFLGLRRDKDAKEVVKEKPGTCTESHDGSSHGSVHTSHPLDSTYGCL